MEDSNNKIAKLVPFEVRANNLKSRAEALKVETEADVGAANALFKECQETLKEIRDTGKEALTPIEDALEIAKARVKEVGLPIADAKVCIEAKQLAFKAVQDRKRAEAAEVERKRLEKVRLEQEAEKARVAAIEKQKRDEEDARLVKVAAEQAEIQKKLDAEKDEMKKREMQIEAERREVEAQNEAARVENERQRRENEADRAKIEADKKAEAERVEAAKTQKKLDDEAERTKLRGLTSYWKYKVLDEKLVPREFCSPDPVKINFAISEGERNIPGTSIFEDKRMK